MNLPINTIIEKLHYIEDVSVYVYLPKKIVWKRVMKLQISTKLLALMVFFNTHSIMFRLPVNPP